MDIKQIQELVKLINNTSIGEITIEEDGTRITIKQKKDPSQKIYTQGAPMAAASAPAPSPVAAATTAAPAVAPAAPKTDNLITMLYFTAGKLRIPASH